MATYDYVNRNGLINPDTSELLSDVESEYRQVFGDDFVVNPETPEGRLIEAEVTSRASVIRNNSEVANQINPNFSGGTFFDSLWSLTGGQREAQSRSTVQILCTGVPGTVVRFNSRISDSNNVIWRNPNNFIISDSGSITVSFQSDEFGPIAAAADTITNIIDGQLGWETVNNPAAAAQGVITQSDQSARLDRNNQLALQGQSTSQAITSRVNAVEGVQSVSFRENRTESSTVIDGVTLVARSIWVAVDGGVDLDVAMAILNSKSGGSNYNGGVSVPTVDPYSGQSDTVQFDRPVDVPVIIRVTARASAGSDPTQNIIDSVLSYANGEVDGERGFVLGNNVSGFEIASAVNMSSSNLFVSDVETSKKSDNSLQRETIDITIAEKASILESDITVVLL